MHYKSRPSRGKIVSVEHLEEVISLTEELRRISSDWEICLAAV